MVRITVQKEPDGWRAAIKDGNKLVVLNEIFDDEVEARLKAAATV